MANVADKLTEGWTLATLQFHLDAIRGADQKFDAERDRRYSEVNIEREKALKINEKLKARGKQLETVTHEEFDDIAQEVGLKKAKPRGN